MTLYRFQARFGSWHRPLDAIEVWTPDHDLIAVLDTELLSSILESYLMMTSVVGKLSAHLDEQAARERHRLTGPPVFRPKSTPPAPAHRP